MFMTILFVMLSACSQPSRCRVNKQYLAQVVDVHNLRRSYQVVALNIHTHCLYYGYSTHSELKARSQALRRCHSAMSGELNVCRIDDSTNLKKQVGRR